MEKETLEEHDEHCGCGEKEFKADVTRSEEDLKEFNLSDYIKYNVTPKDIEVRYVKEFIKKGEEIIMSIDSNIRKLHRFRKFAGDKLIK